jgi:murein DD-endopeptidase MepM/ murein hydrolase activator NlpD
MRWLLLTAGCALIGVVLANTVSFPKSTQTPPVTVNTDELASTVTDDITAVEADLNKEKAEAEQTPPEPELVDHVLKIKRGDNLSILFDRARIRPEQLAELMASGDQARELVRIHPGDTIKIKTDLDGRLMSLHYDLDNFTYLQVNRVNDILEVAQEKYQIETHTAYASGTIDSSLFLASQKAGLSQNLTMELAGIFGWDIDFALDMRQGDHFTVIYEEIFKEGKKIMDGNILAAEFVNQGEAYRALRYTDPTTGDTGYYAPNGQSLRKAFLRTPVNFTRISSKFTTSRFHPVLHRFRSHKGVDYAAPTGTPVRASGDGKIVFRGRKGGYGNAIIIQHGSRYTTLYGHLSKFNSHLYTGSKVKQGQVIAYVGSTGLASGPHLHYEFRIDGVHRNPLTVKIPSSNPIEQRYWDNFQLTTQSYVAQLDELSRSVFALNQN